MYNNSAIKYCAAMAQSVERILGKDEVAGSIPASSSKRNRQFSSESCRFLLYYSLSTFLCSLFSKCENSRFQIKDKGYERKESVVFLAENNYK